MPSHSPAAVEVRGVTKRFGTAVAVNSVSLQVKENEFLSLLGPSGCGKSTLLRLIGGFEEPNEGEIYLHGKSVRGVPPYRRSTNMIFQHLALFPHLSVFDNIAFGQRMKGVARNEIRTKVERILQLVKLSGYEERGVRELSGGQQQRVAIARALVNEPEVLLLDEPLAALDLQLRIQMQHELKEIQRRVGTTFIFVTHDQTEALTMSDRIAVMRGGVIEQVGAARSVYENPETAFVATFLGDSNLIAGAIQEVTGETALVSTRDGVVSARNRHPVSAGRSIQVALRPEKVRVLPIPASPHNFENSCKGRVRRITFKGALVENQIDTEAGGSLVSLATPDLAGALNEGDAVTCAWKTADCVVVTS